MSHGVKARILAFLVLSAVGVVYMAGSYLGLVDRVLGRGIAVQATLPSSGGLFVGSQVTYRGVKVGEVSRMDATSDGVTLDLALEDGTRLPTDSPMYVHNLSAVGEQYLDFEPPDGDGPYAEAGYTFEGDQSSLPVDEGDLLVELDEFVGSVEKRNLTTVVRELGTMFADTGRPLQRLLDSGSTFIREAAANTDATVRLLNRGKRVLTTQQGESENIARLSEDLAGITDSLARSDDDLERVLDGTPRAAREVDALLRDLAPTLPVLLGNAVSVNQVVVSRLAGVEQLLVTYPTTIATGFTGTPGDGYGCSGSGHPGPLSHVIPDRCRESS
ncbi:MCE family protein, partial [Nocardioides hungaricus]